MRDYLRPFEARFKAVRAAEQQWPAKPAHRRVCLAGRRRSATGVSERRLQKVENR
jgi:hypothetical protein